MGMRSRLFVLAGLTIALFGSRALALDLYNGTLGTLPLGTDLRSIVDRTTPVIA